MLNGGGSPGHVFGPIAGILQAVVVNGLVLDRTYPLAGTAEALRRVEQGHARGKVVITVAKTRGGTRDAREPANVLVH